MLTIEASFWQNLLVLFWRWRLVNMPMHHNGIYISYWQDKDMNERHRKLFACRHFPCRTGSSKRYNNPGSDLLFRARSEVLWLRASPEAGEELAERRSFEKSAPGIHSARSAKNRSYARPAPGKQEAGVGGYYMECPPEVSPWSTFLSLQGAANRFSHYRGRQSVFYSRTIAGSREKLASAGSWRSWLVWEARALPDGPLV